MTLELSHYRLLGDILEKIHYIYDEEELSNSILKALSVSLNTEAGSIFRTTDSDRILPTASYGTSVEILKVLDFRVGQGVVGWVAQYAQPVKVEDPQKDDRFMGKVDVVTGFKTRSIIAAPIMAKGKLTGVLEFMNKKDGNFTIPDLELVSMIALELGIAFENAKLVRELRRSHGYLKTVVDGLKAGLIVTDPEGNVAIINPRARQLLNVIDELPEGRKLPLDAIGARFPELMRLICELVKAAVHIPRAEIKLKSGEKETLIGYSSAPIKGPDGELSGITLLFQDITPYK